MEKIYFANNRTVMLENLRKAINEDGERVYSEELIQKLENGDFYYLNNIDVFYRNDRNFMEPLLYAVKNSEYSTYRVYQYYGEELQKQDITLATEIVMGEPKVIEKTAIAENGTIVLYLIKYNPEIIMYMSEDLKADGEFIEEVCKTGDREAIRYVVEECDVLEALQDNPDLANNAEFMKAAIKQDETLLGKASDELKNNYNFINEASKENYEVVGYIINNKEQFGLEAINGAKDTTRELAVGDSIKIITEETKDSEDKRYQKVLNKMNEKGEDNVLAIRWSTAMAAQSDKVTPEYFKKVLDDSILAMIAIQKDLSIDGKEKVSIDRIQTLVTPTILNRLKEKAIVQGLEVDSELESKIEEYTKFFNNYRERLQEEKRKNLQKNNEYKIEESDIEKVTDNARLTGIKIEQEATKNGIENPGHTTEVSDGFTDNID